jgi:hypothetical protein
VSYLGYDRGRLLALRRRLGDLADEMATLRVTDPLAADAARRYRDAATSLTDWRSELAAIDACGFSSPFRPVALDAADPALVDLLHPGDAAWATVTDPRAATGVAVDPVVHARHLAEYLAALDLAQVLGNGARVAELVRLLRDATADAGAGEAFLVALGPDRFGSVVEDLATRVALDGASGEATAQATRAATLIGLLASGLGTGLADVAAWEAELAQRTDPYATALVLRSASLAADELGRVAAAAWRRWQERAGDGIDEAAAAREQAPAILLRTLAAQSLAARRALEAFDDDDLALLFGPSIDTSDALPVLLASADPRIGPPDDVEYSMVNVLGFLAHHRDLAGASGVTDGLGAYAGPYLEHLLGTCDDAAYPARRWDLRGEEPTALLGWIARSPVAAASLESYLDAIVLTRFTQLATSPSPNPSHDDGALVHHLGAIAGAIDAMVADGRVLRAEQRNAIWHGTIAAVGSLATNVITSGLPSGGIAVSRPIGLSLEVGLTWLLGSGPAGVGIDVPAVVAAEGDRIEERRGRREAAYLAAVFGAAHSAGAMPASAAPPPYDPEEPYLTTRNRWLAAAGSDAGDAAARQQLWHAAEAFDAGMSGALNRYPSGDTC